jgi:ABC-type antimicrobial peptide transport system permease subunit
VLAVNVPVMRDGKTPRQIVDYYREVMRRIRELPGVVSVAVSSAVPWRDRQEFTVEFAVDGRVQFTVEFAVDGRVPAADEEHPHASYEVVSPGFFATLGLNLIEGRDFTDADRSGGEPVAIVSAKLAQKMFPKGDALNHYVGWSDPLLKFAPGFQTQPRRIVGIVPDIDNSHLVSVPTMAVYHPFAQDAFGSPGRLVVDARSDPYALVQPITRITRTLSADQPVERAKTLEDIRTDVLSPERLNAAVSGVFAGVSLLIAVVGVAGVLAFSVSGRMREFGIRLAVGSAPRHLLMRVIGEGAAMAVGGLVLGLGCGYVLAQVAGSFLGELKMPGVLPVVGSALVLLGAAVTASAIPALRAARVDVTQALRAQ